jgi:RIO-like serine/threonine protein kinase
MATPDHYLALIKSGEAVHVGRGKEGDVYRLGKDLCVKIARKPKALRREIAAMRQGQSCTYFPRLHESGRTHMVREFVEGISLSQHLDDHPLTPGMAQALISLFISLRRLGFRRIDTRLHHVIVSPDGLRLIDPSNLNKEHDPFPRKAWRGLKKRGHAAAFRKYLLHYAPELYAEWEKKLAD